MSTIDDGGPAFPDVPDGAADKWADWDKGMTLRDYVAAKAMQAGLTFGASGIATDEWFAEVARASYAAADAMLRARGVKA